MSVLATVKTKDGDVYLLDLPGTYNLNAIRGKITAILADGFVLVETEPGKAKVILADRIDSVEVLDQDG